MALATVLTLAACAQQPQPPPTAHPTIVSLNPCTDAILAEVTAPGQLRAISHYSHDPRASSMDLAEARRFRATGGTAEEVLALGADLRVVSGSFDDAANLVALDGYALGTLRASLPLTEAIELYGRIENIWDQKYQTVAGYGTPGRSAYFGARARW